MGGGGRKWLDTERAQYGTSGNTPLMQDAGQDFWTFLLELPFFLKLDYTWLAYGNVCGYSKPQFQLIKYLGTVKQLRGRVYT